MPYAIRTALPTAISARTPADASGEEGFVFARALRYDIYYVSDQIYICSATGLVGLVPASRLLAVVKLRPPSFLMLGMIRLGARSGYAIKQATDVSTRFFWPTSLAQVYPELARLEQAGLLTRSDDPHGSRARSSYELTEQGEAALLSWLSSTQKADTQFRDEGILRLFFAGMLAEEDQLALVGRLRERAGAASAHLRDEIVPLAEALEQAGTHYPALVARLGADTYAYVEQWLARAQEELQRQAS
jgi:PadR family transcriptional regulator AphA